MTNEQKREYYRLVAETGDYLRDGFARTERKIPDFSMPEQGPSVAGTEAPFGPGAASGRQERDNRREPSAATERIRELERVVSVCTKCALAETRHRAVPGAGSPTPRVMLIGEGPGAEEDRTGVPFVGAAGKYLDKWLAAIDLSREEDCYIANIVKCRPPQNRDPKPEEAAACIPYLQEQVDILKPEAILTLGRVAIQNLLGTTRGIGSLRGETYRYRGVPVIPTYHPSGVLRNPEYRKPVWEDLKRFQALLSSGLDTRGSSETDSRLADA